MPRIKQKSLILTCRQLETKVGLPAYKSTYMGINRTMITAATMTSAKLAATI